MDHVLFIFILYPQNTDSQSLTYLQRVNDKEKKTTKNPKHPNPNGLDCNSTLEQLDLGVWGFLLFFLTFLVSFLNLLGLSLLAFSSI